MLAWRVPASPSAAVGPRAGTRPPPSAGLVCKSECWCCPRRVGGGTSPVACERSCLDGGGASLPLASPAAQAPRPRSAHGPSGWSSGDGPGKAWAPLFAGTLGEHISVTGPGAALLPWWHPQGRGRWTPVVRLSVSRGRQTAAQSRALPQRAVWAGAGPGQGKPGRAALSSLASQLPSQSCDVPGADSGLFLASSASTSLSKSPGGRWRSGQAPREVPGRLCSLDGWTALRQSPGLSGGGLVGTDLQQGRGALALSRPGPVSPWPWPALALARPGPAPLAPPAGMAPLLLEQAQG